MTMSPTSARGSQGGRTRFIETTTPPRGSKRSICLRSSALVSRYFMRSNMVSPGGGSTPPTITRPASPSACAPTTVTVRFHLKWASLLPPDSSERQQSAGSTLLRRVTCQGFPIHLDPQPRGVRQPRAAAVKPDAASKQFLLSKREE